MSDFHLNLASQTGLDVLLHAQLMQQPAPPHCVLITGDTCSELTQAARNGMIDVLYKPIRPVRLRAYLNAIFSQSSQLPSELEGTYSE